MQNSLLAGSPVLDGSLPAKVGWAVPLEAAATISRVLGVTDVFSWMSAERRLASVSAMWTGTALSFDEFPRRAPGCLYRLCRGQMLTSCATVECAQQASQALLKTTPG